MRAWPKIVMLAIVACITLGLRPPALPSPAAAHDSDERVTSSPDAPAAIGTFRQGRTPEGARKAPLLAVLPGCLRLERPLSFRHTPAQLVLPLFAPSVRPRSSRGPPALA